MIFRLLLPILSLSLTTNVFSQITGSVADEEGTKLPYSTIYVEGTSSGTTTNIEGDFILSLEPGEHELLVQYIGYQSKSIKLNVDKNPQTVNIILAQESVSIPEIQINADAEDPAYEIIRKARKKRETYKNATKSYEADLYIKGIVKMLDAPSSFLGIEIGDMDGMIDDSTRRGIVYLSESKSKIYAEAPNKIKEVMYASKVAGDNNGISFNQYFSTKFSFYDEYIPFGRNLISPLADASFRHYTFKLEGTILDDSGHLINKISVYQKNELSPAFFGTIYIAEDDWYIHQIDLAFTGKAAKEAVFDTIHIKQLYQTDRFQDQQVLKHQIIDFKMGVFTFKMGGTFSYFLSDYLIEPDWKESPFSSEIFKIEKGASEKNISYWDTIRPIPLTADESRDYIKKDSLEILWNSKPYLDSVDHVSNKFKWSNILFGYRYSQSYKHRYFSYIDPLSSYQYNPIEGHVLAFEGRIRSWNKVESEYWALQTKMSYGFADNQFKPIVRFIKKYDALSRAYLIVQMGRRYSQFDNFNPVPTNINSLYSLLRKENFLKLYDEKHVYIQWKKEIANGLNTDISLQYVGRSQLNNSIANPITTNEKAFELNNISHQIQLPRTPFENHKGLILDLEMKWNPGQKFLNFGEFKDRIRSTWPDFIIQYKKAIPILNTDLDYDHIDLHIIDRKVNMNLLGYLSYRMSAGTFLNTNRAELPDFKHFHGNLLHFNTSIDYLYQFKALDYYKYSTTGSYAEVFAEQHLEGYLLDRIPLINKLGLKSVIGFSSFYRTADYLENSTTYVEPFIGLENIGYGIIRGFRLDYAVGFDNGTKQNSKIILSLKKQI